MNKSMLIGLVVCFGVILIIFAVRLLSQEDNWICSNGQWVEHGKPNSPMPTATCK